jgi:hypothetical protein
MARFCCRSDKRGRQDSESASLLADGHLLGHTQNDFAISLVGFA